MAALRLHRTVPAAAHAASVTTMQRARSLSISPRTESVGHLMVADLQNSDVGAKVGPLARLRRKRARGRVQNEPHLVTLIGSRG